MRFFFFLLALHVTILSAADVEQKILTNQKNLKSKSKVERNISKKLNDIAEDIQKEEKNLNYIESQIEDLGKNIARNENIVKDKEINLKDLTSQNLALMDKKQDLEERIIKVIAEDFSFSGYSDQFRRQENIFPLQNSP
jgi:septal ring factor EnvC (AmiA/AmiB activator)